MAAGPVPDRREGIINRASTVGGIITGVGVGAGLGIVLGGAGYIAGQGTDYILSTREFQDAWQYAGQAGEAAKYAFPLVGGAAGGLRGLANIPHYRNNFRDWMERTF